VSGEVRLDAAGSIAWVVFDNPERRNALTAPMMAQVLEAMEKAAADERIRVVVLRGAGELAFMSGADISAFGSPSGVDQGPRSQDVIAAITDLPKPVIAALRGWCLGAGVLLALSADLRIAGDDLRIGIPAAKLGVAYPREGVARIMAVAGPAVASELLMTGEPFGAAEALRTGLVNRVVPAAQVFDEAQSAAEDLAANAPLTILASKRTIASLRDPSDSLRADAAARSISDCYRSEDFREGQRAFAQKRRPDFKGR
jgi:enoyl-CoA hydratase/carnithine racemase